MDKWRVTYEGISAVIEAPCFGFAVEFYLACHGLFGYDKELIYEKLSDSDVPVDECASELLKYYPEASSPEKQAYMNEAHKNATEVVTVEGTTLPASMSLRPLMPPVDDQGALGSSTCCALGSGIEFFCHKRLGRFPHTPVPISDADTEAACGWFLKYFEQRLISEAAEGKREFLESQESKDKEHD